MIMKKRSSKYHDPLYIKHISKLLNIPENITANIASFLLSIFLCIVTIIIGFFVRKVAKVYLFHGEQSAAAYHYWHRNNHTLNQDINNNNNNNNNNLNLLYLQPIWKYLTHDNSMISPYVNSAVFPGAISIIFYYLACLPGVVLDIMDNDYMKQTFKIQPNKIPPTGSYYRTLLYTFRNNVLFIFPGVLFQAYVHGPWLYANPTCFYYCTGYDLYPTFAPTIYEFCFDLFLSLVVFDAMYHYWHRLHHISRPLYSHIHRIHHEYFSPFSWVTQYEHPLELFAVSALSLVVPISLGLHPFTEWVWLLLAIQLSVDAHSGYDFCVLDKLPFLFFWGGNKHHDIHHQKPKTNFQPFFTWFDIYHGTNCNIGSDNATASRKKKGE